MAFPSHERRPAIGDTTTLGEAEVMRTLARIDPHRKGVTPDVLARALTTGRRRPDPSEVEAVLQSTVDQGDTS